MNIPLKKDRKKELLKEERKEIEYFFYNFKRIRKCGNAHVFLRTPKKVIKVPSADYLLAIERTIERFKLTPYSDLIDRRYFKMETREESAKGLYINLSTYHRMVNRILTYVSFELSLLRKDF